MRKAVVPKIQIQLMQRSCSYGDNFLSITFNQSYFPEFKQHWKGVMRKAVVPKIQIQLMQRSCSYGDNFLVLNKTCIAVCALWLRFLPSSLVDVVSDSLPSSVNVYWPQRRVFLEVRVDCKVKQQHARCRLPNAHQLAVPGLDVVASKLTIENKKQTINNTVLKESIGLNKRETKGTPLAARQPSSYPPWSAAANCQSIPTHRLWGR
ncbi:hypothetical protein J6590_069957 [Homalodisca vitripennis]|nr:hypothetical protein J6590_069957 [Homalodisca vitripennis]